MKIQSICKILVKIVACSILHLCIEINSCAVVQPDSKLQIVILPLSQIRLKGQRSCPYIFFRIIRELIDSSFLQRFVRIIFK